MLSNAVPCPAGNISSGKAVCKVDFEYRHSHIRGYAEGGNTGKYTALDPTTKLSNNSEAVSMGEQIL
jgi:hypothetical protein